MFPSLPFYLKNYTRHTQRNPIVALLASTLTFNASLYWGFINFLIGFPLFVLWYVFVLSPLGTAQHWKHVITVFVLSTLLFLAHALWFAVALIALTLFALRQRIPLKTLKYQALGLIPIVLYALVWFPSLSATRSALRFDTAPHWIVSPFERLNPVWIVNSLYGGLRNPIEWLLFILLCAWIVSSIVTHRGTLKNCIQWNFLYLGFFFLAVVYFAPEKYVNTIYFASRWYPVAAIFIILALPAPKFRFHLQLGVVLLAFIILTVVTTMSWRSFERYENSGLEEALTAIPKNARVLGLDLVKESQILCGRPFLQTFAYAQVLHGAELNFSFALHQSGVVRIADTTYTKQWTPGLEWFAERVRFEDFEHFDYALINAPDDLHAALRLFPPLKPVTTEGRWRLYRCIHGSGMKGPVFHFMP